MGAECFTCGHDIYDEPCHWCELRADRDSLRGLADDLIAERDRLREALIEAASAVDEIPASLLTPETVDMPEVIRAMAWAESASRIARAATSRATERQKKGPSDG